MPAKNHEKEGLELWLIKLSYVMLCLAAVK